MGSGALLALLLLLAWWWWWRRRRRADRLPAAGRAMLISGCDSGIGRRLAWLFAGLGCDVFAGCLDPDAARAALPDTVTVVPLDVTSEDSVRAAHRQVEAALARQDKGLWSVVNNAGVCYYGEFEWLTWAQCQHQVDVNLMGTMRLTKTFLPLLRQAEGRLVTITSVNGSVAYPGLAVYSATKFALEGFHDALRVELRHQKVRVVVVQPGDMARLTRIMARHEDHARVMWDAMSHQDRQSRGDYFRRYQRVTMKNYGLTSPEKFEDSPLLGDVTEAVLGRRPNDRYLSAPLHFRCFYRLLAILPTRVSGLVIGVISDLLLRSDDQETDHPG